MWCSHCHQDVPAIASEKLGFVACARCQRELKFTVAAGIADTGISLEQEPQATPKSDFSVDPLASAEARENLRRLGRQLRSSYQDSSAFEKPHFWDQLAVAPPDAAPQLRSIAKHHQQRERHQRAGTPWFLGLLIGSGLLGFTAGVASLLWSVAFSRAAIWQWGLTATLAGEGLLIVGLTWMAARLWQNSRQLNHELRDVDTQLTEIHELAGSITASQLSSSQQFYHHFSQVANPHMLVANLRGQIDQLAERIAG
jgi:hypothetical protein